MSTSSPYAPPTSSLYGSPSGGSSGGLGPRTTIDIGEALKYPFTDPEWLSRSAIMGLMMLVPLVGPFVLLGWMVQVAERVRSGTPGLPPLDFGAQLSAGFKLFISLFVVIFVGVFVVMIVQGLIMGATFGLSALITEVGGPQGLAAAFSLAGTLVMFAVHMMFALGINVLMPEIYRRGFAGELFPLGSPGRSIRRIRGATGAFFLTVLGIFVGGMMGGLGVLACYLGVFVTLPLGYAATAHLICQWEAVSGGPDAEA
jgi:hypothetical protein